MPKMSQVDDYKTVIRIADPFQKDKECLRPLLRKPFGVCRYEWLKADGYGMICLDGKHHYSSKPENGRKPVLVGIQREPPVLQLIAINIVNFRQVLD